MGCRLLSALVAGFAFLANNLKEWRMKETHPNVGAQKTYQCYAPRILI